MTFCLPLEFASVGGGRLGVIYFFRTCNILAPANVIIANDVTRGFKSVKSHDWNTICYAHGPVVWATVYRILDDHADALDCYQEVFLEAYRQTCHQDVESWPALLKWLATRRAIDILRRKRRESLHVRDLDSLKSVTAPANPSDVLELQELIAQLRTEVAKLPGRQGEAFWLRSIEQLTYAEIARHLEIDTSEVGVLIHRARQTLQMALAHFPANSLKETL